MTDWVGGGNTTSFHYDADGNLLTTSFPAASGETDSYAYNLDDALSSVTMNQTTGGTQTTLASIGLTRYPDDLINVETIGGSPGLPGPKSDTYTYTQQQELASDTPAGGSASNYSYDSARNMTELNNSGTASLSYNSDNELTGSPAGSYAYNPIGERKSFTPTTGTASSYTYNADQNLTQANAAGTTVSYGYDGNGQLQTQTTAGTTQPFTWDDTPSTPNLLAAGSNEYYIYGPGGNAIEQISSTGTVQYLHQDQIGSTRLITSSSGAVVGSFTYNPYGGVLASTGTATSNLGYAGQYTDPTTGLIYDQARWYDPATGQFMIIDPKVQSTWEPYAYGDDDPILNTDPTGLRPAPQALAADWGSLPRCNSALCNVIGMAILGAATEGIGDWLDVAGGLADLASNTSTEAKVFAAENIGKLAESAKIAPHGTEWGKLVATTIQSGGARALAGYAKQELREMVAENTYRLPTDKILARIYSQAARSR